jgi:hypothetical protein
MILLISAMILGFTSCNDWEDHYGIEEDNAQLVYSVLEGDEQYQAFVKALETTGYDKVLSGQEVYTVFVPEYDVWKVDGITGDELKKLVGNHIIMGRHFMRELTDTVKVRALSGKYYNIYPTEDLGFILSNRKDSFQPYVEDSDVQSQNGVIHTIDGMVETVPNIQEVIEQLDPNIYSIFLSEYNKLDSILPDMYDLRLGLNQNGEVIRDTIPYWVYPAFNPADESRDMTVLVPSDEAILNQRNELIALNGGNEDKISPYYYTRLIRNQVLQGSYNRTALMAADTILTDGNQKVIGKKLKQIGDPAVASNGYVYDGSAITYEPLAADFIDSLVYEAEWSLGIDGHEKTIIYTGDNLPIFLGDDLTLNKHLYCFGLNSGDRVSLFIPNVYKGLYQVKLVYKQSDIIIRMTSEGKEINSFMNMETLVPVDPNNEDPNVFPNVEVGYLFFPETGYLNIEFQILSGTFTNLAIDKIILVPVEY